MKPSMKLAIDRMVAEVVLKASNTTPAEKRAARQTLKKAKEAKSQADSVTGNGSGLDPLIP